MSDTVISVENVTKAYRLGQIGGGTLKEDVARWWAKLQGKPDPLLKIGEEHHARKMGEQFWALNDVSFQVKKGEVLGIIGRNGAGKSTLLKILSQVTMPSSGQIKIKGRIASLLEVGTGFHPELTGHENVFLNGAILGMTKQEIRKKFDEIVAFSGIEEFINTPVKRYSSGMYVRLAFAVAAYLEPEILIVDEVLAVGDAEFQKKCLGKMQDVSTREGRTVLFVSHNMPTMLQLCTKVIYMESGKIAFEGDVERGVARYMNTENREAVWVSKQNINDVAQNKKVSFTLLELVDSFEKRTTELDVRKAFRIRMYYHVPNPLKTVELAVRILTPDGRPVMTTLLSDTNKDALNKTKQGDYMAEVEFPGMFLMPGNYVINVAAHESVGEIYHLIESAFCFNIADTGTNFSRYGHNHLIGVVMRDLSWSDEKQENNRPVPVANFTNLC